MTVNRVTLIGNCCKDPEARFLPSGDAVTNLSIATNEKWKDKNGVQQEKAEFHNLIFFRRLAEVAGEYLKKGAQIYVEGKIQTRKYQTKEGQDRYTTEIIVSEMQMLGGKREESEPRQSEPVKTAPKSADTFSDFDDDLPF